METMKEKIEKVRREFDRNTQNLTALNLIKYPEGTLGQQLGRFLLRANYGQNVYACHDDALQLLIAGSNSFTDDIAVQFYLLGNGSYGLRRLTAMVAGVLLKPHKIAYFYQKYNHGKAALRFYDVDHLGLLHLPIDRVRETFMIQASPPAPLRKRGV